MKLNVTMEEIREIIINSNIVDSILSTSTSPIDRIEVIYAYSSIILALLNIRLETDSKEFKALNTIINKAHESILTSELELFSLKISVCVRDALYNMGIDINGYQLITDIYTVLNNIARESVLGVYIPMDIHRFNTIRKHIFTLTKSELSKEDLITFKKYMIILMSWVSSNPKQVRLAINTITSNVSRKELISREDINRVDKIKSILMSILGNSIIDVRYLNVAIKLLIYRNYWMVIPDEIMVLKNRRRLGRLTDRLLSTLDDNSDFKIK